MNSHTTPFAAILESQPPWWRLGSGGVIVVVAYLGMLLAALSLGGGHAAPQPALTPRSTLVVTLFDRPEPVAPPVEVKSDTGETTSIAVAPDVRNAPTRATPPATKPKPKTNAHIEEPAPVASAVQPTAAAIVTKQSVEALTPGTSSAATTTAGTTAAVRGSTTGTATGAGTASPRAGNDLTVLPFTDGMTRPKLLDMVEPQYTREARDASVKGLFLAKCVITTAGTLQKCRVVKGLPMMDQAVLTALARWRYTPVIYQGKPVAVEYVIQVRLAGP